MRNGLSRRNFMAGAAGLAVASGALAIEDKANLPLISKRVEKAFKAPCEEPNDLAFVAEGLWILDQVDPNKAFLVRPEDGSVIREIRTESIHGSGIALHNGALWISSTKTSDGTPPFFDVAVIQSAIFHRKYLLCSHRCEYSNKIGSQGAPSSPSAAATSAGTSKATGRTAAQPDLHSHVAHPDHK